VDTAERLKQWFKNLYEREQFKLSMGEQRIDAAGFHTLLGFLAEGVARAGYESDVYLAQLIGTHQSLRSLIEHLQKIPGHDLTSQFHYPLILGVLIENAIEAVAQLKKEDRDA
jgi:hypothetical protein